MRIQDSIGIWADIWQMCRAWWNDYVPLGGMLLSIIITILRVAYTGGGWKKMLLEGALCGALTLTVASALEYFALAKSLTVAFGGAIGFIGVDQIRVLTLRFLGKKFGGGK